MAAPKRLFVLLFLLLAVAAVPAVHAQAGGQVYGPSLYRSPTKEIKVEKIILEGNRTVDRSLVVNTLQVREGEEYLPPVLRQRVRGNLHRQRAHARGMQV